jgi:hypothetical protein
MSKCSRHWGYYFTAAVHNYLKAPGKKSGDELTMSRILRGKCCWKWCVNCCWFTEVHLYLACIQPVYLDTAPLCTGGEVSTSCVVKKKGLGMPFKHKFNFTFTCIFLLFSYCPYISNSHEANLAQVSTYFFCLLPIFYFSLRPNILVPLVNHSVEIQLRSRSELQTRPKPAGQYSNVVFGGGKCLLHIKVPKHMFLPHTQHRCMQLNVRTTQEIFSKLADFYE